MPNKPTDKAASRTACEHVNALRMDNLRSDRQCYLAQAAASSSAKSGSDEATTIRATTCYRRQNGERSECRAAGNFDDRAVDVARFVRREPRIRVGDFLGLPQSAQRDAV